jgi:hypothetical protein
MSTVRITRTDSQIKVASPYSPDLPARAKTISGRWDRDSAVWAFPIAAEQQVRDLYMDVYGEWDDVPTDTVTLICECDSGAGEYTGSLTLAGRVIARASGRDSGAKTADGVIVLSGGFTSGGSVKNWRTVCRDNTAFKVLNVPRAKADVLIDTPEWCSKIEIEAPATTPEINRDALIAERTRLAARIAEIDALLHS